MYFWDQKRLNSFEKVIYSAEASMMILTMWGFGTSSRKEAVDSGSSKTSTKNATPTKKGKRGNTALKVSTSTRPSRSSGKEDYRQYGTSRHCEVVPSPVSFALSDETMSISDTQLGIEVSLDSGSAMAFLPSPLSFEDYLGPSRKVYRSQFSTNFEAIAKLGNRKQGNSPDLQTNNKHRVPLFGRGGIVCDDMTFEDIVFLLQSHVVKDEQSSLEEEMKRLDFEVEALEADRMELEQDLLGIRIPKKLVADRWDIDLLLKGQQQQSQLTAEEIDELRRRRGRCWTIQIQNKKSRDSLCSQLGYVPTSDTGGTRKIKNNKANLLSLTPANCRESHNVRQLIVQARTREKIATAIFVTRDTENSWGHVPARLFRRLKKEGIDLHSIDYLSTGPGGAYFCELSTGHTWWGSSDPDFIRLVMEWKVSRVAFGASRDYGGETLHSWIIVGRDGRVAWKNIPARLHNKLEFRLADNVTLAEVTLGPEGAYFVRFLDGTVDYCLPAKISSSCESIERDGGKITNVILRVDSSQDFVIRHTEVSQASNNR